HSEIHGSTLACSSPWLIAANHVLHRLLAPRHPPNALTSLTTKPCRTKLTLRVTQAFGDRIYSIPNESQRFALANLKFQVRIHRASFYYSIVKLLKPSWRIRDSNPRPLACKANALPAELIPQMKRADDQ